MVDGVSGTDLITSLLDATRRAQRPAPDNWVPAAEPSDAALITGSLRHLAVNPAKQARAFQTLMRALPRAATHLLDTAAGLRSVRRQLKPRPTLSIEGAIGPHRRWAAARAELADVKAIKQALGGTINDVVLAVIAGAFRELLAVRGEDPDHAVVRTLVPVSIRSSGDHALNNQVSAMIAELPVGIADPVERLASMCQQLERLKASNMADTARALPVLAGLAAPSMLAAGLKIAAAAGRRFPQRAITTVTTNVPGPQHPLYAVGRQMVAYLPFVPLSQGVRLGVAILSYNGNISFGVTATTTRCPSRSASVGPSNPASTSSVSPPAGLAAKVRADRPADDRRIHAHPAGRTIRRSKPASRSRSPPSSRATPSPSSTTRPSCSSAVTSRTTGPSASRSAGTAFNRSSTSS